MTSLVQGIGQALWLAFTFGAPVVCVLCFLAAFVWPSPWLALAVPLGIAWLVNEARER